MKALEDANRISEMDKEDNLISEVEIVDITNIISLEVANNS